MWEAFRAGVWYMLVLVPLTSMVTPLPATGTGLVDLVYVFVTGGLR